MGTRGGDDDDDEEEDVALGDIGDNGPS